METLTAAGKGLFVAGPAGMLTSTAIQLVTDTFVDVQTLLPTLKPGDLIEFNRGHFSHWAMYSDTPGKIFNICAEDKNETQALIKLEELVDVARGDRVRVNNQTSVAQSFGRKPQSIAKMMSDAKAVLGTKLSYQFTQKNCEYYSTLWRYGSGWSTQVNNAKINGVATGIVAQIWGGIGAIIGTIVTGGNPVGGLAGYAIGSGAVGGLMAGTFEATKTTNYTRYD